MSRHARAGALTAALALAGAAPAAALPPGAPLPGDMIFPEVRFTSLAPVRFELANGLVVYFLEDPSLPLVELTALVRAGAIHEPAGKAGLAALAGEVMRSGGTAARSPDSLNAGLENMASVVETSIGTERATATVSALARHFPATLAILADLLRDPAFHEEKLEIARGRAIEAVRRQNDDPLEIGDREFAALLYPGHPYGRTATIQTLGAITREDLVAFHRRLFHSEGTILAVSGAVSEEEVRRLVARHLGGWRRGEVGAAPPAPPVAEPLAPRVSFIAHDVSQSVIRVGHLGLDRASPDRQAVAMMNRILGQGGFNCRLVKRLRVEAGIAYDVGSAFTLPAATGLFFAETQTRSETTAQAIELLIEEIRRMRDEGVTADELEEARSAIVNRDVFQYATAARIVVRAAELELDRFPADQHERDIEAYRAMTVEQVNAAARKYLRPDSLRILVVGKSEAFERPLSSFGEVHEIRLEAGSE